MKQRTNRRILIVSFLMILITASQPWAATIVWDGDTDNSSNTGGNWVGGTAPLAGAADTLQFGADPGDYTVTIYLDYTQLTGISFTAGAATPYDISDGAGSLTFGDNATISNVVNANHVFNNGMTFGTGAIFNIGAGGLADLTVNGVIAGTDIIKNGAGTLILGGANTYTGGTILNTGVIVIGNDAALGTGTLSLQGANANIDTNAPRSISNAVDLGANRLYFDGTSDLTISGVIEGAGGQLFKEGLGTLTLSGANTYTGDTVFVVGKIVIDNDAALGTGDLRVDSTFLHIIDTISPRSISNPVVLTSGGPDNVTLTFGGTSDLTITGVISELGGVVGYVVKNGPGTLTLSAVNTYTGVTTLNAGTLNGVFSLGGNLVHAGGTLAPGNSIGTVTINAGDYTLGAGATLEVEVENSGGALNSDLIDVTAGAATLNAGGTINVVRLAGSDVINTGDQFRIIQTTGGVTDNGPTITSNSAVLSFIGAVSGNDYVLAADVSTTFASVVSGGNNTAVMGAIDSDQAAATGDYATVIGQLQGMNAGQLYAAAEDLNPVPHASAATLSTITTQYMAGGLSNYLRARRMGVATAIMARLRSANSNLLLADASDNPDILGSAIRRSERNWQSQRDDSIRGFIRPFGIFYDHEGTEKLTGFSAQAVGAQFGFDKSYSDNLIMGIGGGYTHSFIDYDNNRGDGDIDSLRVGPYGTYYNDDFYIDGSLTFGYHSIKNERKISALNRTAKSDYNAYDLSAYIGAGYDVESEEWTLTPNASLQYINYHSQSFKESGAGAAGLDVDSRTTESLRSKLGVNAIRIFDWGQRKVASELFCGWAHEFMDESDIGSRFLDGTAKFTNDIDSDRDDSVYFGVGVSTLLKENVSSYVRYEGEYSSGNSVNALNVGITIVF